MFLLVATERKTSLLVQKPSDAQDQQLLSAGFSRIDWRGDNKPVFVRVCQLCTIKGFWSRPPGSTISTNRHKPASPPNLTSPLQESRRVLPHLGWKERRCGKEARGSGKCAASCGNEWVPNIVVVNRIRAGELHSTGLNGKWVLQHQVRRHGLVNCWSTYLDVRILKHAPRSECGPARILRNTWETHVWLMISSSSCSVSQCSKLTKTTLGIEKHKFFSNRQPNCSNCTLNHVFADRSLQVCPIKQTVLIHISFATL